MVRHTAKRIKVRVVMTSLPRRVKRRLGLVAGVVAMLIGFHLLLCWLHDCYLCIEAIRWDTISTWQRSSTHLLALYLREGGTSGPTARAECHAFEGQARMSADRLARLWSTCSSEPVAQKSGIEARRKRP